MTFQPTPIRGPLGDVLGQVFTTYGLAFNVEVDRLAPSPKQNVLAWDMRRDSSPESGGAIVIAIDEKGRSGNGKEAFKVSMISNNIIPLGQDVIPVGTLLGQAEIELPERDPRWLRPVQYTLALLSLAAVSVGLVQTFSRTKER